MQCFGSLFEEQQPTAVALGFFDGIHLGHRSVLSLAADQKRGGLIPVCLTFSESPKSVIGGKAVHYIMTKDDKIRTLASLGLEHTFFADFRSLMDLSAAEFVRRILADTLKAQKLFCGFNYRFGKNAEGDIELLRQLCERHGVSLRVLPPASREGSIVSSTRIKKLISSGYIKRANELLCSDFGFCREITHGKHLGHSLGAPTINQPADESLILPKFGVYLSRVTLENGAKHFGVTNVGVKPTVGGTKPLWETFMPEYSGGDIYGQKADVRLLDFIRPEIKFDSLDSLKAQIIADAEKARLIYAHIGH